MSKNPLNRRTLAAELFPDTVDPLGSLRWCLAALRKALGSVDLLLGAPIALLPMKGIEIDVYRLDLAEFDIETVGTLL